MKQTLLILAVAIGQSVLAADEKYLTKEESAKLIEAAIRKETKKPEGELTKADYEKVTKLVLIGHRATDVKGLEKLTQLEVLVLNHSKLTEVPKGLANLTQLKDLWLHDNKLTDLEGLRGFGARLEYLWLSNNPDLTKAQIAELQKALPKCKISSNPTK